MPTTPSFVYARNERLYAILESATTNTSGVTSLTGANHFAHINRNPILKGKHP